MFGLVLNTSVIQQFWTVFDDCYFVLVKIAQIAKLTAYFNFWA